MMRGQRVAIPGIAEQADGAGGAIRAPRARHELARKMQENR